ncbi:protein cornichon [Rosa sericea]
MEMLWTWLLSIFFILTLLCLVGYQLMCLMDLEDDYINSYDSSSRINRTVLPEFIVQGVFCVILFITRHWFMLPLALPHLYYNVNSYMKGRHLADVTEIYNLLSWEKKQRIFKIAYLFILAILSLFGLFWSIGDE